MKFTVVLHTDDGRRYGVTVPDLPGCFSVGDGMDEALESVREAIDLHAETLIEDGGVWAVVDVPVERFFTLPKRSISPCRACCWPRSTNMPKRMM